MIERCLSESSTLAIFWVVIGLSENLTVRAGKLQCMISTKRARENDDLEVSHTILKIGHLLGRNCFK